MIENCRVCGGLKIVKAFINGQIELIDCQNCDGTGNQPVKETTPLKCPICDGIGAFCEACFKTDCTCRSKVRACAKCSGTGLMGKTFAVLKRKK